MEPLQRPDRSQLRDLCASLFKDEFGKPIVLTPGQLEIYASIVLKERPRVVVNAYTQYGKSMTVALGILTRAMIYPERWYIVAGKINKAGIIMAHVTGHILDNDILKVMFSKSPGNDIEEIRKHRSKSHVTFTLPDGGISEIMIGSANDALGFGSPNVVLDEAALVEDTDEALVLRMLLGKPDNFYMKIGNPFRRNHFYRSSIDPDWLNITLNVWDGVSEGRLTAKDVKETEGKPFFSVLYECKFPRPDEVDDEGWLYLIMDHEIKTAQAREIEPYGKKRLALDVARGGRNKNVCVLRGENYARVLWEDHEPDLMKTAQRFCDTIDAEGVSPLDAFIDDTGVGGGVTDRCKQLGYNVNGVRLGDLPQGDGNPDSKETKEARAAYLNIRAEIYGGKNGLVNWLKRTGKLEGEPDTWNDLLEIRYMMNNEKKLQLEPKVDMRKRGVESPDRPDALALTFAKRTAQQKVKGNFKQHGGVQALDPSLGIMT